MRRIPVTTYDREELIGNIPFSANSTQMLNSNGGQIVDPRWLNSLAIRLEGRITMPATGGPAALTADGVAQMIELFTLQGTYRPTGQQDTLIQLRGSDLKFQSDFFTLNNMPSLPSAFSFAASATNDFRLNIIVPFAPLGVPLSESGSYLLDVPNYDKLQIMIQWGDGNSIFATNGGTVTFSAYGSAAGSPAAYISGRWALAGPSKFAGFTPGRVFKYFRETVGTIPTTTQTAARIDTINRGNIIRSVGLKTGVKSTNVTGGNNAYASLTDTMVSNWRIMRGTNNQIRYYAHQQDIGRENTLKRGFPYSAGKAVIDFAQNGYLAEAFNTRGLQAGADSFTDVYVQGDIVGAANQAVVLLYDEIRRFPAQRS